MAAAGESKIKSVTVSPEGQRYRVSPARRFWIALAIAAATCAAGCASDSLPSLPSVSQLNPFKEKQQPLPGKRVPILPAAEKVAGELAPADAPIVLPAPRVNEAWSQPGGDANNAPGHLALSGGVREMWSASAGEGSSKTGRVMASPIVYDGRIFTLDADATISAFSANGGSAIWRQSLKPEAELSSGGMFSLGSGGSGGGYGGGIAADGGRIYAASGFGNIVALDPSSGKRLWEKNLGAPVRAAPTAAGERLFVVTTQGRFFCLSGVDGTELWSSRGLPAQASIMTSTSPAVDGDIVVVPFPSGDVMALKVADGSPVWTENLARTRTSSQLTSLSDAARPAISSGTVFAVGHAGRMIATQTSTGERLWSLSVPGTQTPWVAGESVFVVDTSGQLMAVSRTSGKIQWTMKLPGTGKWSGPTLAGGTLWLASNKGDLVGVEATTGRVATQQNLGNPVYIAPVVAQGRMFVLTDNAKLIAFN